MRKKSTHQRFTVRPRPGAGAGGGGYRTEPRKPYVLALANEPSGAGALEPLQSFMTNPAGAAIVNAIGPIRQVVRGEDKSGRRYLVIAPGTAEQHGAPVQVQAE